MIYYLKKFFFVLISLFGCISAYDKPFIVGELTGQLGNQMFVIAATVSLALDNNATPIFPDFVKKTVDSIPLNYKKVFYHLKVQYPPKFKSYLSIYREPFYHYKPITYKPYMCLSGYFQSEKYFIKHKNEIIELLKPRPEIENYLRGKYGSILENDNTVSIHLRSYLDFDPQKKTYPFYGRKYIEKAISLFPDDSIFLVFSNDMTLCKKELDGLPGKFIFIEGEAHYNDLYLMSMCKHNIISNSSFSWWAAYLNENPNKIVLAPSPWVNPASGLNSKDVIPDDWIKIDL